MWMRRTMIVTALALASALEAQANDGFDLALKSKSMAMASVAARNAPAPFAAGGRDPLPELLMREEQERRGPRGACEQSVSDVCYDVADGRITYRPARQYMPRIDGLTAESISLRHDRIIFKYSF